ncbi:MAG: hypothetical protein H6Q06_2130 [Acidobacteria bacterium]|nr:hypothetical protein [Acidobacteriota bacterium]
MPESKSASTIGLLHHLVDQAYSRPAWHGPNLRNSLRGITAAQASWRPAAGRHNIWEIMLHAAYWKYVGCRRLRGGDVAPFPRKGSNWFASPEVADAKAWRQDLKLLDLMHREFCAAVKEVRERDLNRHARGSKQSNLEIIMGVATHDLYHAGQIRILRRLLPGR